MEVLESLMSRQIKSSALFVMEITILKKSTKIIMDKLEHCLTPSVDRNSNDFTF